MQRYLSCLVVCAFVCFIALSFGCSKSDLGSAGVDAIQETQSDTLPEPVNPDDQPLPDEIYFKTTHDTFNEMYYFAVRNGLVYIRERSDSNMSRQVKNAKWELIYGDGKLKDSKGKNLTNKKIVGLTVDYGDGVAVDEDSNFIHSITLIGEKDKIVWQRNWGWPFDQGAGMKLMEGTRSWTYASDSLERNKVYRDDNGHIFQCMVSPVYALSDDGQRIHFCDPWTPSDWGYQLPSPYRGKFISESLAAAGSLVLIINKYGDMFTMLNDFDIGGGNPGFRYTYDDDKSDVLTDNVDMAILNVVSHRRIPDGWTKQPKIDGAITDLISVQFPDPWDKGSAPGSEERILRVEGMDDEGNLGYYEKRMTEDSWKFHIIPGWKNQGKWLTENNPFEDCSEKNLGEVTEYNFNGKIERHNIFGMHTGTVEAKLEDFNFIAEPAIIKIKTGSNQWIELKLHHHFFLRTQIRENPGFDGHYVTLAGQIEIPAEVMNSNDDVVRDILKDFFQISKKQNKRRFIDVRAWPPFNSEKYGIVTGIQAQPDSIIIRPEISTVDLPLFPVPSLVVMTFGKEYKGPNYSGDGAFKDLDLLELFKSR